MLQYLTLIIRQLEKKENHSQIMLNYFRYTIIIKRKFPHHDDTIQIIRESFK